MKKILLLFTLLFLLSSQGFSAPVAYSYQIAKSFSAPGTQSGFIAGTGAAFHQLVWNVIGSISACSVRVDSSTDGVTYNVGDVIAAQDCSVNNNAISTSIIPNYVRINVVSFTGTGSLITVLDGYTNNPNGSGAAVWGSITGILSSQTDLQTALNLKANLASPALSGVPTAPTAAPGTNTTQLATTAFVTTAIPAAGANTALSNLASVAINLPLLAGADNTIALGDATHRWTNLFATAFNCGIIGTTRCIITGNGSISGSATISFPTTGGTASSPFSFSNYITVPSGATSSPSLNFAGNTGSGFWWDNSVGLVYDNNSSNIMAFDGAGFRLAGGDIIRWTSSNYNAGVDTGMDRMAAGVVRLNTGTAAANAAYLQLGTVVVGSLPVAAAGNQGRAIYVTDSTAVAIEGQTCAGGSSNPALAFSNGTVWKCF